MCRRKGLEWDPNPISFSGHEVETKKALDLYVYILEIKISELPVANLVILMSGR